METSEMMITESPPEPERPPFLDAKRSILVEVLVLSVVATMLQVGFERNNYVSAVLTVLTSLGYGIAILAWCKADSRLIGFDLGKRFPYVVIFFGTLSVAYYLFRTRGFIRGLAGTGLYLLFLAALLLTSGIFGLLMSPLNQAVPRPGR